MAYGIEDINAMGRLLGSGTNFNYGPVVVKPSTYSTIDSTGATVNAVYASALGNLNGTPAALSQNEIELAEVALLNMKDPLGNNMLVQPDTLIVSTKDAFNAPKLLKSAYQPSIPGVSGGTLSAAPSGTTEWTNTENILYNRYQLVISRYLPQAGLDAANGAWFLGQKNKGIIFQRRDGVEVVQEAVNAGQSFEKDAYRFRSRSRWTVEWLESRFWYRGN